MKRNSTWHALADNGKANKGVDGPRQAGRWYLTKAHNAALRDDEVVGSLGKRARKAPACPLCTCCHCRLQCNSNCFTLLWAGIIYLCKLVGLSALLALNGCVLYVVHLIFVMSAICCSNALPLNPYALQLPCQCPQCLILCGMTAALLLQDCFKMPCVFWFQLRPY